MVGDPKVGQNSGKTLYKSRGAYPNEITVCISNVPKAGHSVHRLEMTLDDELLH